MQRRTSLPPHRVRLPQGTTGAEAMLEHLRDQLVFDRDATEVLDCGCGTGRLSCLLAPFVRRVTAVDESPGLVAELRRDLAAGRVKNVRAFQADLVDLPRQLAGREFDLVVAAMVCHHVEPLEKFLLGLKSLLKPDGVLCIIDLQEEDGSFHAADPSVPHAGFAPADFARLLADCGFFAPTIVEPWAARRSPADAAAGAREYPLFMALADNAPPLPGGEDAWA